MAIKFVLVEIVLVETVLVGDPLYLQIQPSENLWANLITFFNPLMDSTLNKTFKKFSTPSKLGRNRVKLLNKIN